MSFTTPCFIRKNTPELRKKLEKLGYDYYECFSKKSIICNTSGCFWTSDEYVSSFEIIGFIDCGTNEELFLAIAALRDDTCIWQYITDGEKWELCVTSTISRHILSSGTSFNWDTVHKATVEELIEHFNDLISS